jgi:hypothetical protein
MPRPPSKADRVLLVLIPATLSVGHLLLCIYVEATPSEGWGWVVVTGIDFPLSIPLLTLLHALPPLLSFGIFGTLWWYLLGWLLAKFIVKCNASMSEGSEKKANHGAKP